MEAKKKIFADALKVAMPIVVPIAAKMIINLVPSGSKVDVVLKKYQDYWGKITPALSTMVLQITNAPEFVDDIIAELSAEVVRTIKERYKDGIVDKKNEKNIVGGVSLQISMTSLPVSTFLKLTQLINSLPEEKRQKVLNFESPKEGASAFAAMLTNLSSEEFKSWVDLIFPDQKPREETAFEKKTKESLKDFQEDSRRFFQKDSWLTKLAKDKGLM